MHCSWAHFLHIRHWTHFSRDLLFEKGSPHTRQGHVSSSSSLLSGVACFFVLRFFPDAERTAVVFFFLFWTSSFSTKLRLSGDDVRHAADSAFRVRALGAAIRGEGESFLTISRAVSITYQFSTIHTVSIEHVSELRGTSIPVPIFLYNR